MHLLVLPGDGIGPEITAATLAVLRAVSERFDLRLQIEEAAVGHAGLRAHGSTIHADIVEKARHAEGVVLGPTSTFEFKDPSRGETQSVNDAAKGLDLFANIRPAGPMLASRCGVASSTWWLRARIPKGSTPTATWRRAAARCWSRRTSPFHCVA